MSLALSALTASSLPLCSWKWKDGASSRGLSARLRKQILKETKGTSAIVFLRFKFTFFNTGDSFFGRIEEFSELKVTMELSLKGLSLS